MGALNYACFEPNLDGKGMWARGLVGRGRSVYDVWPASALVEPQQRWHL